MDGQESSPDGPKLLRYCFDIDGTICETEGTDYVNATPIPWMVDRIQQLHAEGHSIVYYTARGMGDGGMGVVTIMALTVKQLREWGLPNPNHVWSKPPADFYVDDRSVLPEAIRWGVNEDIHHS